MKTVLSLPKGNMYTYLAILAFALSPGVWDWDSLFLGINEVTRLRGNPTSAFVRFYFLHQ